MSTRKKIDKDNSHKEGDKHGTIENAEWYQCPSDKRWMLRCTCERVTINGMVKKCSYHERESRYEESHEHFKLRNNEKEQTGKKQLTIYQAGVKEFKDVNLISDVAKATAELNVSSSVIANPIMLKLFNTFIEHGFNQANAKQKLSVLSYSDVDINNQINIEREKKYKEILDKFRQFKHASAIVDAGTVHSHHTLEIILVIPGILPPFPYKSYEINNGDKNDYKCMFMKLFKNLYEDEIYLTSICGDNLPAQRNIADHTRSCSIQDESYKASVNIVEDLLKETELSKSDSTKKKSVYELNNKLEYFTRLAAVLYVPCCNHVLNLSFNDIISEVDIIHDYLEKIEKYNELFKDDRIKKEIGYFNFTISPTRWIYLFDGLIYMFKNQKKLKKLYKIKDQDQKIKSLLDKPEYDSISSYPDDLIKIINIIWPLHSFSTYVESDSTLLCYMVPALDKVIRQIKSRCEKFQMITIGDSIINILNERFQKTGRWDLMKASYILTPYGRNKSLPKNDPMKKKCKYKPNKIEFFELKDESVNDNEILKFKKYVQRSKTVKDSDSYYYFDDASQNIGIEERESFLKETLFDMKQLKDVTNNIFQLNIELAEKYLSNTNIQINVEFQEIWKVLKKFIDEFYNYFNLNKQESVEIAEISLYIETNLLNISKEIKPEDFIERIKTFKNDIENLKIVSDSLRELIDDDQYPMQKMKNHLENLDIYSDEVIFQIATVMQKLDKHSIWDSVDLMLTTPEEGTCFNVVNEMVKILFPLINSSQKVTPYLEEYIGKYTSGDKQLTITMFSNILRSYHPVLFWIKLKEFIPEIKYLAEIALRLVSLPASEAGCERMFSKRRKIITAYHTRISEKLAFSRAFLMSTRNIE